MPDNQPPSPKKFLTNQGENTLSKRLEKILPLTQDFDCLVGYFFISGYEVDGLKNRVNLSSQCIEKRARAQKL